MSTTDLAQLGVAAATAIVIAVRAFASRGRPPTPASRWLTGLLLLTVAALLVGWPPLMEALAGDGGGLIALRVVQHGCVLGMALAFLAFAEHATRASPEQARRVIRPAVIVVVTSAVVMSVAAAVGAADLPGVSALHLLTPAYATSPAVAVYLVTYALPLGLTTVEVGLRCGVGARRAGRVLFRTACSSDPD